MALGYRSAYSDWAVVWTLRSSISKDPRHYFLLHKFQTGCEAHPATSSVDICVPSPKGKVAGAQCAPLLLSEQKGI